MRLRDCKTRDVVDLPHHHPRRVRIDDIPTPAERPNWQDLLAFAWSGDDAEGITSMSPDTQVTLIHRDAPTRPGDPSR